MIQRIQTVFFLFAAMASALAFFFPIAWFYGDKHIIELFVYKVVDHVKDNPSVMNDTLFIPAIALSILLVAMPLIIIFQYKKLQLQLRLTNLLVLLAVILVAVEFLFYTARISEITAAEADYAFGIFVPLISIVFLLMAQRGIRRDIRLLRSVDRLR